MKLLKRLYDFLCKIIGSRTWWIFSLGSSLATILLFLNKVGETTWSAVFLALAGFAIGANKYQAKINGSVNTEGK